MLKLLGIVAALMLSASVSAVGMGGINVTSALGQPLRADIDLVAISKTEKDSLVARLAAPDSYKNAGLEYPYGNKFKFEIQNRANGQPYIKASSSDPVNDPFVSLLVELTWSAGKLSREYTFLLDPPGYVPEQPAQAQLQAVSPEVLAPVAMPDAAATLPAEQVSPVVAATSAEQAATSEESAAKTKEQAPEQAAVNPAEQAIPVEIETEPAPLAMEAAEAPKEWLEVHRGDTMYKLAERYKLADMNLERMLVAMYRANADKFDGRNMNRIRAGKILHLPSQEEYDKVTLPDAVKEIHAQAADWNAYRQKLASAVVSNNESQDTQQVATGKIRSSVADMAPVVKESAKEVLKLSKGEAPGDQVGTGAAARSEQEMKNAAQEDAIAKSKALKEEQMRAAMLEKNLKDMQRLAELKAEAAAAQAPPPAATKPAVTVAVGQPPVKPAPAVKPAPVPAKPEPALLDQVMEDPLYMAGAALVVLVLGGLGYTLYRRKKNSANGVTEESVQDIGDITGRMAAPVMPSPDTGDFTVVANDHAAAVSHSDTVDPISEADLFLNFGRDVQAEEILKEALQSMPNNHQIHLKLLGIYVNRKDANAFASIAQKLQGSGDDEAWQQAAAMGRKLDPSNPMYGGGFKSMEDTGSATVQMTAYNDAKESTSKPQPSALDFDFDVGASAGQEGQSSAEQDFLGDAAQQTSIMSADGRLAAQGEEMDFDITSSNPSMAEQGDDASAAALFPDDLAFDVSGTHPSMPAAEPTKQADDGGMAFTLDFPVEKTAAAPAPQADIGLSGINLNFDDEPAAASGGGKDDHWQDVATKLDLAKAYHEMGDASGAREILEEVLREGDTEQREAAQSLFEQLG